jgi:flagellar biosynthesis protein FlhG
MSSAVDASSWLYSFKSETTALNLLKNKYPLKRAKTVAISSGKGGVGKTSISVKLGQELATQGYKVLLLDCDFNLSNTSIKLNLPLSNNFYDLVTGKRTFEDCLIPMGGLDILPSLNGNLELFNDGFQMYEVIVDIIIAHEANYDYILLDCPAGVSRDTISLNAYCENRVVVVTPDKSSITDSYSLIKILAKNFGVKENHLVINMVNNLNQYNRVVQTME